jgi:hypothetical protein
MRLRIPRHPAPTKLNSLSFPFDFVVALFADNQFSVNHPWSLSRLITLPQKPHVSDLPAILTLLFIAILSSAIGCLSAPNTEPSASLKLVAYTPQIEKVELKQKLVSHNNLMGAIILYPQYGQNLPNLSYFPFSSIRRPALFAQLE